jgi:uncharacterized protein YgbK (DUF1537 family)
MSPDYVDMKARIAEQSELASNLVNELAEIVQEGGLTSPDLLDTLARLGVELKPIKDHNIPSYAYFIALGMDTDNLISQLDIEVP